MNHLPMASPMNRPAAKDKPETPHERGAPAAQDEPFASLELEGTRIGILGTAHVSESSRREVRGLIESGEYEAVAVELCKSRHKTITDPGSLARMDLWQVIRERRVFAIAALLVLGGCQQRIAERFGIEAGGELKEAVALAASRGLPLAVIDREVGLTLKRLYFGVSWWRRPALLSSLLAGLFYTDEITEEEIEEVKRSETLETAFRHLPLMEGELEEVLIHERDRYMAAKIRKFVSENKPASLLAVVGAGHLEGLRRELSDAAAREPADDIIARHETTPAPARWWKYLPWAIVAAIVAGFVAGFMRDFDLGVSLIVDWILINGGLAGLGAALASAHWLTVAAVFVAAPLTSINPAIGAGMVAAAVELYLRKPRVADFEQLRTDTAKLRGWRRNRVARTLLIFILSTLGSAAGTYLGGFHIYDSLAYSGF